MGRAGPGPGREQMERTGPGGDGAGRDREEIGWAGGREEMGRAGAGAGAGADGAGRGPPLAAAREAMWDQPARPRRRDRER